MNVSAHALALVADIGGTNTRVALAENGSVLPETIEKFKNADFSCLEDVLDAYLKTHKDVGALDGTCVALAGPVHGDTGEMTNLSWVIRTQALTEVTGAQNVAILNDLQAQGHAVGWIAQDHLTTIRSARPAADTATKLVVGLGTGFNCAPVHETPAGRMVLAAEAGHCSLPVRTQDDLALSLSLSARHGATVEQALAGPGLGRVLSYHMGRAVSPADAMEAVAAGDEAANAGLAHYVTLLGRVLGDLALDHLPDGGIYLVGGVARAVAPYLNTHDLCEAMADRPQYSDYVSNLAISLVEDDFAALTGCAQFLVTH